MTLLELPLGKKLLREYVSKLAVMIMSTNMDFVIHTNIHAMSLRAMKTHTAQMMGMDFVGAMKVNAGNQIAPILATKMAVVLNMKNNAKNWNVRLRS